MILPFVIMPEWLQGLGLAGVGAVALRGGQLVLQWRQQRVAETVATASTDLEVHKHRDRLTIEMLDMARSELSAARAEIKDMRAELEVRDRDLDRLRRIEWRLSAYEEAINHIEALIAAELDGRREAAEHAARLFLARMEALKLKMGDNANAVQRQRAAKKLIEDGI